jgi:hypothetical protein
MTGPLDDEPETTTVDRVDGTARSEEMLGRFWVPDEEGEDKAMLEV